jgi:Bacterial Ig-like domain
VRNRVLGGGWWVVGARWRVVGARWRVVGAAIALALTASADAQPAARKATNIAAILAFPNYFHGRPVLFVGNVAVTPEGRLKVSDDFGSIDLVVKGNAPDGLDEIRGEYWDVGRMKPDDIRLRAYDVKATFHFDPEGAWPRPGEVTAVMATSVAPAAIPVTPSIRAIVLHPSRYIDQKVTITGQYSGRNLLGDLPDAPGKSRYDFVLRSADGAIWISNMRPKLRDASGKEFELALDSRIDTGRWLQVRGTVMQGRGLEWIEAEAGTLTQTKAPTETVATQDEPVRVPSAPAPEVIFSAPTQDETDVAQTTTVRIQFSRDLDPATLRGHIRAHYLDSQTVERGEPATPPADFTFQYIAASRVLEVKFTKPLERFRTINVDLLDGILGTDKQPQKPWTLTFAAGGP